MNIGLVSLSNRWAHSFNIAAMSLILLAQRVSSIPVPSLYNQTTGVDDDKKDLMLEWERVNSYFVFCGIYLGIISGLGICCFACSKYLNNQLNPQRLNPRVAPIELELQGYV